MQMGAFNEIWKNDVEDRAKISSRKPRVDFKRTFAGFYRSRFYPYFKSMGPKAQAFTIAAALTGFVGSLFYYSRFVRPKRHDQLLEEEVQVLIKARGLDAKRQQWLTRETPE